MKKYIILFYLVITINAQDSLSVKEDTSEFWNSKNITYIATGGGVALTLISAYTLYWNTKPSSFHFSDENWFTVPYSWGMDKVGHFYVANIEYHMLKNIMYMGGHSKEHSMWWAASLTAFLAMAIELGDGFTKWGFDYQDIVFNLGGLGFGLLQDSYPFVNNFKIKFSFWPERNDDNKDFLDEFRRYDGYTWWLTMDIANIFPNSIGKIWPDFIQPAIGFSVFDRARKREFAFGLDFKLETLFGYEEPSWNIFSKAVEMLHLPAPGIKYSPYYEPKYQLLLLN
ncbi:MAG: DUF2279 domain-containing protein [Ignavibacteriales bacterium]|nr:DUF2279 domain-containing protein [Ignavibacteriales bacterium]